MEVFFGRDPDAELDKYLKAATDATNVENDLLDASAAVQRLKAGKHWAAISAIFGNDTATIGLLISGAIDLEFVPERAAFLGAEDISTRIISLIKKFARTTAFWQERVNEYERKKHAGDTEKELLERERSKLNVEIDHLRSKNLDLQKNSRTQRVRELKGGQHREFNRANACNSIFVVDA